MTLNEVVCNHPLGSCPWASERYVNYCVAEKQNPPAYYTTQVLTEVAKQKEDYLITAFENVGINPNIIIEQDALINKLQSQLNAVRELHKPVPCNKTDTNEVISECGVCKVWPSYSCNVVYPCPTIQAIEAAVE